MATLERKTIIIKKMKCKKFIIFLVSDTNRRRVNFVTFRMWSTIVEYRKHPTERTQMKEAGEKICFRFTLNKH